jgi:hypothetical protein
MLQPVDITIGLPALALVNATGSARATQKPVLFAGNEILLRCSLVDAAGEAVEIEEGSQFYASLDTEYGPDHDDLVAVANDKFNIDGDWIDIDLAEGKFCFRLTTATDGIVAALAGCSRREIHLEIWVRSDAGEWRLLCHDSLIIRNVTAEFALHSSDAPIFVERSNEGFLITPPAELVSEFDPSLATMDQLYDFVATLAAKLQDKGVI